VVFSEYQATNEVHTPAVVPDLNLLIFALFSLLHLPADYPFLIRSAGAGIRKT
jgi:hypothetical protein